MLNKFGKTLTIFVVLIIILLLSSTSIGFYLYHMEQNLRKNVETELDSSRADGLRLQSQIKDLQTQLTLAEDKKKEADQKINNLLDEEDLNEGLRAALKKENASLQEQLHNAQGAKEKIQADLDAASAKLSQYEGLLKASEEKVKEFGERLDSLTQANKALQAKLDTTQPGGTNKVELDKIVVNPQGTPNGRILTIDTEAEFVIFSLGLKEGIKPGDLLSVYEDNQYLGDIKATRVQDEMSAADLLPPLASTQVHKNDIVVLKP